jgi:hypothetical protein
MTEVIFILLIAAAVFVLQYIFRGPEDKKPQNRGTRPGVAKPAGTRPRRQTTDLDRYLEETRKQRQQQEAKPVIVAEVVPESAADRAEALERERRKAAAQPPLPRPPTARPIPPRPERRPRTQQQPPPPPPAPPRRPSMPTAAETPKVAQIPVVVAVEAVPPPAAAPRDARPSSRPEATPAVDSRRREQRKIAAGPIQMELARLIRTPNGLAAAMILREIFGEPLCRRR